MKSTLANLLLLTMLVFPLVSCRGQALPLPPVSEKESPHSCISVANKIETMNVLPRNVLSPKNTELPKNPKIIDIYEIIEYSKDATRHLAIDGKRLLCKGKAKTSQGIYPIEFYLMIETKVEYIVLESQGKRKWIFKWKANEH